MQKSKRVATKKDSSPVLLESDTGNEVAKGGVLSVVLPWPCMQAKTSQVPEETTWPQVQVPQGQRSKRKRTQKKPLTVVKNKTRKSKRKTENTDYKIDSEVFIPRRSYRRGHSRNKLSSNTTEISDPAMLNSKTFELYLENIWREFPEEKRKSFTYFDCLWFSLYSKKHYKEKVLNWIKKKNIFSKKYVFVPIVQWSHWSLLILCHFGESGPGTRCMLLLDSLQTTNPKRLEPGIRRFILDIHTTEKSSEEKEEEEEEEDEEEEDEEEQLKKIPLLVPKVPQQKNDKECGNFVLYYIKLFIESAPENFSVSEGFPYFMKEDWFTSHGLEVFNQRLDSIRRIIDISDEEEEDDDDIHIRDS